MKSAHVLWSASNLFETLRQTIEEDGGPGNDPVPPEVGPSWRSYMGGMGCMRTLKAPAALDRALLGLLRTTHPVHLPALCCADLLQVKELYVPFRRKKSGGPAMVVPFLKHLSFLPVAQVGQAHPWMQASATTVAAAVAAAPAAPECSLWWLQSLSV